MNKDINVLPAVFVVFESDIVDFFLLVLILFTPNTISVLKSK